MPAASLKHIQTITLASPASTVTFTNIPQTYNDLVVFQNIRLTGDSHFYRTWFNGTDGNPPPTSTQYQWVYLWSWDTGSYCYFSNNSDAFGQLGNTYNSYGANTFNFGQFYVQNYSSTTLKKSVWSDSAEVNTTNAPPYGIHGGYWDNTSAITSMTFRENGGTITYAAGSTFRLYGL